MLALHAVLRDEVEKKLQWLEERGVPPGLVVCLFALWREGEKKDCSHAVVLLLQ